MNALYGGFAASLMATDDPAWVMNVVPASLPNTLGAIYDRGLLGVQHDWLSDVRPQKLCMDGGWLGASNIGWNSRDKEVGYLRTCQPPIGFACIQSSLLDFSLSQSKYWCLTACLFERPGVRHSRHIHELMTYCMWLLFKRSPQRRRGTLSPPHWRSGWPSLSKTFPSVLFQPSNTQVFCTVLHFMSPHVGASHRVSNLDS